VFMNGGRQTGTRGSKHCDAPAHPHRIMELQNLHLPSRAPRKLVLIYGNDKIIGNRRCATCKPE
jgi:hypothetical protein